MSDETPPQLLSPRELAGLLSDPSAAEARSVAAHPAEPWLVVDLEDAGDLERIELIQPACVVIGVRRQPAAPVPDVVDVVADSNAELARLCSAISARPVAASVLVQVLRHNARADVHDGLLAESLAYSTLQHGAEFVAWLAARSGPAGRLPDTKGAPPDPVLLAREGRHLRITLARPDKRNAYSRAMRDALCSALELPLYDPEVALVTLAGAGKAFCAGGDLDEFGQARDGALAHATRMTRSAGALLHRLRARVTCDVHGACIGAGIELPAFTGRIRARNDAFFQLPEVAMGLIPGAGGTVSLTRRIGRLRTALLALTGARIDAATALDWGLVDTVVDAFD